MHYIKSIFVGFLAVVVTAVASALVSSIVINRKSPPGYSVGWDPTALAKSPLVWILVLLLFAAGFFWQFRRA